MFGWNLVLKTAIVATALTLGMTNVSRAADEFTVTYQLAKWKTKHFDTQAAAKKDAEVLEKKLGCEVKIADHDGHFDVQYRCPSWRVLTLKTDDECHEWEKWLKKRGFETKHTH